MQIEESKSSDYELNPSVTGKGENDIRSRLRKKPNKTKFLYTDDYSEKKSKKKEISSPLNIKETCRSILDIIKKDPKSELFRQPAIKSFMDQKDRDYYKKKIKEPRDLGYIAKKLKTPHYTAKEFYDDLELCWSNALLFNDSRTEVYHCATYLKDLSNKLYKEKNFHDIINKEKEGEKEKETNSNNNTSSNTNTNDTPNKTPSKVNKKNNNKDNKDNDNDKNERIDIISSNSNYSSQSIKSKKNDNSDSSYNSEIKNNKLVGKKRKRQKIKEDKVKDGKNDEKNKNLENDKKSKKGRKKKTKNQNEESIQESIQTSHNKLTLDDIKNKYPIKHQIISNLDDIETITKLSKSNSVKLKNGKNVKKKNNTNNNNHNTSELNNNKKKRKYPNSNNNSNNNNININILSKEDKRKVFYEIMWEIFDGKNPFFPNSSKDANNNNNNNSNNNDNNLFLYNPMKYITENKELSIYDKNTNIENVYNVVSLNPDKKQVSGELGNKNNKGQNNNGDIKYINNSNNNSGKEKRDDKNMQLRIEIAKYFDNLTDNNMIELLVYIENIRPQSIRLLENDTIYLDLEAFNDETFIKVFEFVKKHI